MNLDGHSVSEALQWVSRESGRKIQYASAAAESLAQTDRLHGDFNVDVQPSRKLELFMMTVDLNARIEGDVIVVSED